MISLTGVSNKPTEEDNSQAPVPVPMRNAASALSGPSAQSCVEIGVLVSESEIGLLLTGNLSWFLSFSELVIQFFFPSVGPLKLLPETVLICLCCGKLGVPFSDLRLQIIYGLVRCCTIFRVEVTSSLSEEL